EEYSNTIASANGESARVTRLSCDAPSTNTAEEITTNVVTNAGVRVPAGRARVCVRGFTASIVASARRLKAIAAERAETIATIIHPSWWMDGRPLAASMAPHSAKGSAKTECSHLIISSVTRRLCRMGMGSYVETLLANLDTASRKVYQDCKAGRRSPAGGRSARFSESPHVI